MDRKEWLRIVNGDCLVPSKRKKRASKFEPDQDYLDKAKAEFTKRGGKIKIPVESS